MAEQSGLTVRQHEREAVRFRVEFVVAEEYRRQVAFSQLSKAHDAHAFAGEAVDISSGGMGIECTCFVPRMCEGDVRIYDPTPVGTSQDGEPIYDVAFEHRVKIRRIAMINHDPSYALGLSFVDPEPDLAERVEIVRAMRPPETASKETCDG